MPRIEQKTRSLNQNPIKLNSKIEVVLSIKAYLKTQTACLSGKNKKARCVTAQGQSILQTEI